MKKNTCLKAAGLAVASLLCSPGMQVLRAQCPSGALTLSNQAQVDNFPTNYPGCSNLTHPLTVTELVIRLDGLEGIRTATDLTFDDTALASLNGLSNLTQVSGTLSIRYNDTMISLAGLDNLTSVGGGVSIIDNPQLKSLARGVVDAGGTSEATGGLMKLTSVGKHFQVANGSLLISLKGLESLETVGEALMINDHNITSLTGLGSLVSIGGLNIWGDNLVTLDGISEGLGALPGDLIIRGARLQSIAALHSVTSVGKHLSVNNSNLLESLNGLQNITSTGANAILTNSSTTLSIGGNPKLTNLSGLGGISSVRGHLDISGNAGLTSLSGLGNSLSITSGNLVLYNNPALVSLDMGSLNTLSGTLDVSGDHASLASLAGLGPVTALGGLSLAGTHSLTSLAGLGNVANVWGNVTIIGGGITTLAGLGADVNIWGTLGLYQLTGSTPPDMGNIARIGTLLISNNPGITSLGGEGSPGGRISLASGLREGVILTNLTVQNNNALQTLSGMGNLAALTGTLTVTSNPVLKSLSGLDNLKSANGVLVYSNPLLETLSGLGELETVNQHFQVYNSPNITSLAGLEKLKTVGGSFYIANNNGLQTLAGLDKLQSFGSFIVTDNPSLSTCAVESVCGLLSDIPEDAANIIITGNATGCLDRANVEAACLALPVTLAGFEVKAEGGAALLKWITTEETRSERFGIEHSRDALSWRRLGEIAAKGESISKEHYQYIHTNPFTGINYYRLKMVDLDGSYAYSKIESLVFSGEKALILYPNPVSDRVFITAGGQVRQVELIDLLGRTVQSASGDLSAGLDVSRLVPGLYRVKLSLHGGYTETHRLAIAR